MVNRNFKQATKNSIFNKLFSFAFKALGGGLIIALIAYLSAPIKACLDIFKSENMASK